MGIRGATETAKGYLGCLAISIATNLLLFAYLFNGKGPNVAICGVIGGIAGAFLLLRLGGSSSRDQAAANFSRRR